MNQVLLGVGFGLVTAAIIAMSSVGMSLQFAVTRMANFSHGALMTVGAYAGYVAASIHANVIVQGLAAVVVGALFAFGLNRLIFRPFRKHGVGVLILLVITIATAEVIQSVLQIIFGATAVDYPISTGVAHKVGPFSWTRTDIVTMLIALAVLVAVHLTVRYTKFGKAQRAVADDIQLSRTTGIRADRIIDTTWLIDGALAGLAGMFLVLQLGSFGPTVGFGYLLVIFASTVVGGIGQMYGAMIGALIIGIVMEVGVIWVPSNYKESLAFVVLLVALFIRPQGLIPARGEAGVL